MTWLRSFRLYIVIFALLPACSETETIPTGQQRLIAGLVVDHSWLAAHLDDAELLIIDARDEEAYNKAHIAGSLHLPAFHSMPRETGYMLPPIPRLEGVLGRVGITASTSIVFYDSGDCGPAARWFWVLETLGHENVAVLHDGFETWRQHHPVATEATQPTRGQFIASVRPKRIATRFATQRATQRTSVTIIDNRTAEVFNGRDEKGKPTHIPSAVHVSWKDHLVLDGKIHRLRPIEDLAKLYAGIPKGNQVITYCLRGQRSSTGYLALRMLGYDVAAYDGSWQDWVKHRDSTRLEDSSLPDQDAPPKD